MAISTINTNSLAAAGVTQAKLATGVAGTGPAFSATNGTGGQSISANTYTKVALSTEQFDTNSNYDTSTYRFTPTVAGYYELNITASIASGATGYYCDVYLYKNGANNYAGPIVGGGGNGTSFFRGAASGIVYANGVSDYFELYVYTNASNAVSNCMFSGYLVRAA